MIISALRFAWMISNLVWFVYMNNEMEDDLKNGNKCSTQSGICTQIVFTQIKIQERDSLEDHM